MTPESSSKHPPREDLVAIGRDDPRGGILEPDGAAVQDQDLVSWLGDPVVVTGKG